MVESINSKGRRRRDTDSSTKSDKSDISLLSVESGASSASNPTTKKQTGANKANTSAKARTAKGKYISLSVVNIGFIPKVLAKFRISNHVNQILFLQYIISCK